MTKIDNKLDILLNSYLYKWISCYRFGIITKRQLLYIFSKI